MELKVHCKFDEMVPVSDLRPYPKNRNQHPPDQIERLSKIIAYQGVRAPIVCTRDKTIAKGHGTLEAIVQAGGTTAPIVYQDFESDEQLYAFVQSDNAIASWADLDFSGINSDLPDLGPDFDIDLLGLKDFFIEPAEHDLDENSATEEESGKHFLEVELSSEKELVEVYEELLSRGLIVRLK